MDDNEIEYFEKIVNNEKNKSLMNLTFDKIEDKKKEILEELQLPNTQINDLLKRLEDYRYVEEIHELQTGSYIRWIDLNNPEKLDLKNGAVLSEIKVEDNIILVFKNFVSRRFFQIIMDENLIFQKLSDEEKVLLYALDYIGS